MTLFIVSWAFYACPDVPEIAPNTKVAVVSRIKDGRLKDLEVKTEHHIEGRD